MRIALVTESFYPAVDAATTTVKHTADRLIDTGHDVVLVAPAPGLATYRRSTVARISPHHRPGRAVHDVLADVAPDLVLVVSPAVLGRKALKHARRLRIRTVTLQQAPLAESTDYWKAKVAGRSDRVLVTCAWMQRHLADHGVEADRWEPGVDVAGFAPQLRDRWLHERWARARQPHEPLTVVGYVGSLHRRNGVRRLLEVASVPGTRLVVIGDGPQKAWLARHLPGAVLLGALGRGELATAIASLDVLVHPGEHETDCHALREAAASGVPVVAPATGGALDVVDAGETGLLYDPAVRDGLAAATSSLVADRFVRSVLGYQARAAVEGRDWAVAVDELVALHLVPGGACGDAAGPAPGLRIA